MTTPIPPPGRSPEKPRIQSRWVIITVFMTGLLSATAIRAIIVLMHTSPALVRPVWYFAIIGNLLFFYYRYMITRRRKRAITEFDLIRKIKDGTGLDDDSREVAVYLLRSVMKSPENYNYLIIFIFSFIAIALDIIMSTYGS